MTNKVHIDAPAGVIEIEGERDFVEGLLARLFPLIEEAGFGSRPVSNEVDVGSDEVPLAQPETAATEEGAKQRAKRRRVSAPPKGQSCGARITALKDEGFFNEHRTASDIVEGLKSKGWKHNSSQVGAALTPMFEKGQIQRTKEGNSSWKYYWDRA